MKNYINGLLRLASVAALFYIIYNQRQQIIELKQKQSVYLQPKSPADDSLNNVIDILRADLYKVNEENTRFNLGLERLRKQNPNVADQLEDYIYNN